MTARLRHSRGGLLRALQISRAKAVIFIEGKDNDPYFYDHLVAPEFRRLTDYRIMRSEEIVGQNAGGKKTLRLFYEFLRRSKNLILQFKGESKPMLFYLDKDIDEIRRTTLRSRHVVYTRSYDVEGEIYRHGDLADAVAAAASLLASEVMSALARSDYLQSILTSWRPWVEYCVAAQFSNGVRVTGYGSGSRLHVDLFNFDGNLARAHDGIFSAACAAAGESPAKLHARAVRAVDKDYRAQSGFGVFKGKWFSACVAALLERDFPGRAARVAGLPSRITGHLLQTLDFSGPWTEHYRQPLRNLMAAP